MGSQTLEILRQGVWASLTGGWFYDPHQGVFCNIVHLYLWLFLLCFPFVTFLYFPATLLTWSIYCVLTSFTILGVKVINMALHRLYDRAQTLSESNLKNPFFKITKESEGRDDDVGIEMQVMSNDMLSRNSVDKAINEASEENSIMSMENVNSIIDLKVDVHRKNSSESIELMFSCSMSSASQQDQQSITGSTSVNKSLRSGNAAAVAAGGNTNTTSDLNTKYLTVYPEHESELQNTSLATVTSTSSSRQPHLLRKSSEDFKRRHQRRRLERQNSLDAAAESALVAKLARNQSDTLSTVFASICNETFLHHQQPQRQQEQQQQQQGNSFYNSISTSKVNTTGGVSQTATTLSIAVTAHCTTPTNSNVNLQRLPATNVTITTIATTTTTTIAATGASTTNLLSTTSLQPISSSKTSRLQRHRSSETHDERLRQQTRGLFLPIHHEHHHISTGASSSGTLAAIGGGILDTDELELGLSGSVGVGQNRIEGRRGHGLQSWVLGSSSDVYIEDDSFTKSDLGIEQIEKRNTSSAGSKSRSAFVLQQQQHATSHYPHQQQFRLHRHGATIRKDSSSTMSALQLPVAALQPNIKQGTNMKRRRHSNATSQYKNGSGAAAPATLNTCQQQPTVRRIKSAALEISCPHPSVSNLTPHPNSVEAINGQQQIKNPQSALLPPPSKSLVRNPHLNLCPKFGGSFGSSTCSASSLNFGGSGSGSTMALIESVYPIVEQADERASLDLECGNASDRIKRLQGSTGDLEITDIDNEDDNDDNADEDNGEDDVDDDNDNEEHDAVSNMDDEDDKENRRHKKHGCHENHATCEPDVCQILADDEFKDFDDNLEQILNEIQSDELEMQGAAALSCTHDKEICEHIDSEESDAEMEQHCDEAAATTKVLRERLTSTDSETDNNGSRSPLLSSGSGSKSRNNIIADKALMMEIAAVQQQKPLVHHQAYDVRLHQTKGEGDSGCPSSDCEQVSASSKDMLLSGMDIKNLSTSPTTTIKAHLGNSDEIHVVDVDNISEGTNNLVESSPSVGVSVQPGKSLGAIPKVVKYREDPSMNVQMFSGTTPQQNLHKRRAASNGNGGSTGATNGTSKAASRTSSSTSSRSFSADSFSADIHKMLWLMSGGAVDESGRPIPGAVEENAQNHSTALAAATAASAASASASTCAQGHVVPSSMSMAHFQFYQDALNALHTQPATTSSVEGLSIADRMYLREKLRRSSKQNSDAGNASLGDYSHLHDLPITLLTSGGGGSQGRSPLSGHQPIGGSTALSSTSQSGGVGARSGNTAPLTIQGLINVINERTNSSSAARIASGGGGSISTATPAAILNVDGHQIEHYCDYWRPACLLSAEKPSAPKSFYKYRFKFCGYEREYKISMDRLELLALFDRDLHWLHIVLSVMLAAMVSYLGATILQLGFYNDLFAFLFCAVIAGSQYSLVKSVQPDAASPIHGFNKTVAYSRAIYFSFCGCLLLLLQQLKLDYGREPNSRLIFFGINYSPLELATLFLQIMSILLLCFPLIFSLGLFPQINTFLMYLLEQIDMHIFGGNAAGSLLGSFLCVLRSIIGIMIIYGPLYAALAEGRGTQYIVFSIFCSMLIPLGYHLSRSASDFSHLWSLIKTSIVSTYRDDDDELSAASSSAASSQKLTTSTPKRNKSGTAVADAVNGEQIEMSSMEKLHASDYKDTINPSNKGATKSKSTSLAGSSQNLVKINNNNKKPTNNSSDSIGDVDNCDAENNNENAEENINDDDTKAGTSVVVSQSRATTEKYNVQQTEDDRVSSSSTTNPGDISTLTAGGGATGIVLDNDSSESPDPLPKKLQNTVNTRLKNDLVVTTFLSVIIFGLHCSTVFTVLQPDLNIVLYGFTGALGLFLHYIIPQMRKHMPWLCFARPLLRQKEFGQFEVADAAKVMWFEKVYIYLCMLERNVLFPLLVISALTADAQIIANKFGIAWGTIIVATCSLKFIRNAYSDPTNQYLIVMFTVLFFRVDFKIASETFLIDYFFISIAFRKCCDFLLKLQFIVTYIAPWQITWGSAFHAFAQPFSVPHSAMLFLQAGVSALLSTPLNPFLGSAIFLTSYVRPIKFWERDYNTRRIDHSNTRLSSQLERDLGADDNNLNSIFYEHLTRSLQHSLCGDLLMGRWGNVNQGDCFVLASDYLNCLVHIIELGNGLCTFQMRGLEFRGTYCQQREVEAITEDVEDNDGCCCCDPGHLPRMLSANAMFSTRWLAWQVVAAQYVLEGYSISDNLASATLQVFEYRKVLITYYLKSIIYYVVKNPKLEKWLSSGPIQDALQHTLSRQFVDLDPIFNYNLDEDFDFRALGITRTSFCFVYLSWIQYCCDKRKEQQSPPNLVPNSSMQSAANESTKATTPQQQPTNLTTSQGQSQSQTQLRARPHKSATMSGTGTGNTGDAGTVNINAGMHSSEHIATSYSFANISRQTSESAPGLTGTGINNTSNFGNVSISTHIPMHGQNSFENSSTTVGYSRSSTARAPQKPPKTSERYYSTHHSPTTENSAATATSAANLQRGNVSQQRTTPTIAKDSAIVSLCLALGLLARRSLATASHSSLTSVEFFLHGLHALFKGDFRITSPRDEWVFADMELLHAVVAPAVKMALKLQQDHISNPDEFLEPEALHAAIASYSKDLVISHEADPVWRSAVLRGAPNLLALRHVMEDGSDEYRIIRLTKRFLSFRVIKLNRECVRGLWAGQQQELIYLRNRNPERGSIQNAKQALRNIINSSCDQPIGYPIYVSPLTTSYADTNEQLCQVIGGAITLETIKTNVIDWWHRVRERCRQGCSSGSALETANLGGVLVSGGSGCGNVGVGIGDSGEIAPVYISAPLYHTLTVGNFFGLRSSNVAGISNSLSGQYGSQSLVGVGNTRSNLALMNKPTSTTLLAGLLNRERDQERERETGVVRDSRILRKGQGQSNSAASGRNDRERRATLPITNASLGEANSSSNVESNGEPLQLLAGDSNTCSSELQTETSPRYAKISCSSGNLGINNIITTPGDYPRKSKGPICLTAAAASLNEATKNSSDKTDVVRRALIEMFKKVIIVDGTEIYDCLDLGRRIDVVWPSEKMRANGGRLSWKNWTPCVGMVGYVVHYWLPNHADQRFRSHVNRTLYLIEIGDHYVPVGEFGVREYHQIMDSRENLAGGGGSNRCSMQREFEEYDRTRDGLTPILGSSVESPTTMTDRSVNLFNETDRAVNLFNETYNRIISGGGNTAMKISAVSSSSSEDEELNNLERRMEMHRRDIINMMKLMSEKKKDTKAETQDDNMTKEIEISEGIDMEGEENLSICIPKSKSEAQNLTHSIEMIPKKVEESEIDLAAEVIRERVDRQPQIKLFQKVIIVDSTEIYDCLDQGFNTDIVWPNEMMRANGGRFSWKDWSPCVGMSGLVVHYWIPNHVDLCFRSHVNQTLYLIEIGGYYVPVGEPGVREYYQIRDNPAINAAEDAYNMFVKKCKLHRRNAMKKSHDSTTKSPPIEKIQRPLSSTEEVALKAVDAAESVAEATVIDVNNADDEAGETNVERKSKENKVDDALDDDGSSIDKQKDTDTQQDNQQENVSSSDV